MDNVQGQGTEHEVRRKREPEHKRDGLDMEKVHGKYQDFFLDFFSLFVYRLDDVTMTITL